MTLKQRFHRWLYFNWRHRLSESQLARLKRKLRRDHLHQVGMDLKCPGCHEWFSLSGLHYEHRHVSVPEFGAQVQCGGCGTESYWRLDAPVAIHCDRNGVPFVGEVGNG